MDETMKKEFKNPDEYKEGDIIISAEEIDKRLDEFAAQLSTEYKGKRVLLVGLLTGAAWVTVDLFERLHMFGLTDAQLTFMKVSSYQSGDKASYEPRIEYDMLINPQGRYVLLIDDIADTGKTLSSVVALLKSKDVAQIKSLVLDNKPVDETNAGADVKNGVVAIPTDRLYHLIDLHGKTENHLLRLEFQTPGTQTFAFTFG